MASSSQGSVPNVAPQQLATAVFVFRQIICLLFITAWMAMFCVDTFFDTGEVLVPFWFNCIGVGVLAFSLGVNVENLAAFRGMSISQPQYAPQPQPQYIPQTQPQSQPQSQAQTPTQPQSQPARPYVPPDARR